MARETAVVGRFRYEYQAQLALTALEAEGIVAVILADNAAGMLVVSPWRVMVHADDKARASEILEAVGPDSPAVDE
jgi:hypothetical protein